MVHSLQACRIVHLLSSVLRLLSCLLYRLSCIVVYRLVVVVYPLVLAVYCLVVPHSTFFYVVSLSCLCRLALLRRTGLS